MQRVNYDLLAHLYDEPCRDHPADAGLADYLRGAGVSGRLRVLDIGCGTGKQLAANREAFPNVFLVGVDLFRGMLNIASKRCPSVTWVQGNAIQLPLVSGSIDYATNQFSYAHIRDRSAFLQEVHRVLKPGGRFVMTNIDPWEMPDWIIYRFFPESRALDDVDFLPSGRFVSCLETAGFANIQVERRHLPSTWTLGAFRDYASDRHRASQFMAISDREYSAGLDRIQSAIADAGTEEATVESDLCIIAIRGDRPG